MEKVKPLSVKYQERFKEWCASSTSHGIPNIARGRNLFIKIMWTLFFLGSFGYCTYVIVKSILDYVKYETTVSIKNMQELPTPFPAVTFCNINPFNEANAGDFLKEIETVLGKDFSCLRDENIDGDDLQKCFDSSDSTDEILDQFVDQLKRVVLYLYQYDTSSREKLGYDLETEMLLSCRFNRKECSAKNFTKFWSNQYGNCYTFNDGNNGTELLKTNEKGPDWGLSVELVLKSPLVKSVYEYRTGLYLIVHNQTEAPFTLNYGITIPTGNDVYVGVDRTFIKKKESPYSDCMKELKSDNTYANRLFGFFRAINVTYYDQDLCFDLCYQDKLIDKCNCSDIITPTIRGSDYCFSGLDIICMENFAAQFSTLDLNKECQSACKQDCESIEYDVRVNSATYPSESYLKLLLSQNSLATLFPKTEAESFARSAMIKIRVNYENNYYTSIEENPSITVEGLLGNIGGQLGLFIGISFLSFYRTV